MKLHLDEAREAIVAQEGHLLVTGGPESGKTTIALLKAQRLFPTLKPGQEFLFLSFSRSAIRQVMLRCREILSAAERRSIETKTYHSFCLELLQSHGRLFRGEAVRFLYPGEERLRKSVFDGDWTAERDRLSADEGLVCFDLFARATADLFENCASLRRLIADKFPMIIVDEFQDTDDDQWRIVKSLASETSLFCLADPEQRIFEYRPGVDPRRLEMLQKEIAPAEFDLGADNHRSPNAGILRYADAVLRNRGPLPETADVKMARYWPNAFHSTVHAAVLFTFTALVRKGVVKPCVAVLCRSNAFVADLSAILSEEHVFNDRTLRAVEHDVVWDAELSAAAATVVGSVLEWPASTADIAVMRTLRSIADFYRLKNAEKPTKSAATSARQYDDTALSISRGDPPRLKAGKALIAAHEAGIVQVGDPVADWLAARRLLHEIDALHELYREVRLVRLFRATDALASSLAERWLGKGTYAGASEIVKRILDQEKLIAADRDPEGCILMNMHKAKGKEFDGVVLVEGAYKSEFFNDREPPPNEPSRRLLRVALTRARTMVMIVRPQNARPLVD
jgi:DNA helicase II / ATP-dependent DNA helicase PcrA